MEADKVEEKLGEITNKLVSLDWHDGADVIDTYFSRKAQVYARPLHISGGRRLIKQMTLYNKAFSSSELIGNPSYNQGERTIHFSAKRRVKAIWVPLIKYVPVVRRLRDRRLTVHFDVKLQLGPKKKKDVNPDEVPMLMVTRMDIDRREKIPLENYLPYIILQPFLSTASNVIATASKIVTSNPSNPQGVFNMVSQGINSFVEWGYGKYANIKQRGFKKQDWAEEEEADLPSFRSVAITTAHDIGQGLESRAKRIGVPVDKIKAQAQHAVDRISGTAAEVKDQAEKPTQDVNPHPETSPQDTAPAEKGIISDNPPQTTQTESATETFDPLNLGPVAECPPDRPTTPLGGGDPTAPGAPSYAQAAAPEGSHDG